MGGGKRVPGAIMGMHFLAITAGGFGWVRVGRQGAITTQNGGRGGEGTRRRTLLIGCACLAHLSVCVCVCLCRCLLQAKLLHCLPEYSNMNIE